MSNLPNAAPVTIHEVASTKHTPGTWRVYLGQRVVSDFRHGAQHGDLQYEIAECRNSPNPEANARLIAAAPELLAALRLILKSHDESCAEQGCRIYGVDFARIAIAKAEGGAL